MTHISNSPLAHAGFASDFQHKLGTGALMAFSSTSKQFYGFYRHFFWERMNELLKLAPLPIPRDALSTTLLPALQRKITVETNAACEEMSGMMVAKDLPLMAVDDPLKPFARRQDFRKKLMLLLQLMDHHKCVNYIQNLEDESSLNFVLSTIERLLETNPENPLTNKLYITTIGCMLASNYVDNGRLVNAWNGLIQQWHNKNPCQQAEALLTLSNYFAEYSDAAHPKALPFMRALVANERGWADEMMRRGFSYIVETMLVRDDNLTEDQQFNRFQKLDRILTILEAIANPESLFEVHCETIGQILDSSIEEYADEIFEKYPIRVLENNLAYLRKNLPTLSLQEQLKALWNCVNSLIKPIGPQLPAIRKFLEEEFQCANTTLKRACFLACTALEEEDEGNPHELTKTKFWELVRMFKILVHPLAQPVLLFENYCSTIQALLDCATEDELKDALDAFEMQSVNALFQYCTENWNSMTALEQAKIFAWWSTELESSMSSDDVLGMRKKFLANKTFVWKTQEMPLVASLTIKLSEDIVEFEPNTPEIRADLMESFRRWHRDSGMNKICFVNMALAAFHRSPQSENDLAVLVDFLKLERLEDCPNLLTP